MSPESPSNEIPEVHKPMEVTSVAESMTEVTKAVQERFDSLKEWDENLDKMNDDVKELLIKSMDRHTLKDRVIEGYPALIKEYQDLKLKALDILGEKSLQILGGENLEDVIDKLTKDKVDLDKTDDFKIQTRKKAILKTDLTSFIKICDKKLRTALPAQISEIDQTKNDGQILLKSLDETLH